MDQIDYIELSELQNQIKKRIGNMDVWVRSEIESHNESGGHHYFSLLQKSSDGTIEAKARAVIWRSNANLIKNFQYLTGKGLDAGLSVVFRVQVNYNAQYGLSLVIQDIDASFTIGQRELEKQASIKKLKESGLMDRQQTLEMPFLPRRIALISSKDAAGYGDFMRHIAGNQYGFQYDIVLFQSLMQGENAPASIIDSLEQALSQGGFDLVMITRGGGAESDLYCYDDYEMCCAIARCPVPVITAIGHERDYHIADMVAHSYVKTPTALADMLIDLTLAVESQVTEALERVQKAMTDRIQEEENKISRCVSIIRFAVSSLLALWDSRIAALEAGIKASDPRAILRQGYALAVDKDGTILKNVHSKSVGDDFSVRFCDGSWNCSINEIKSNKI